MPVNRASKLTLKVSNRSNVSLRIEEPLASAGGILHCPEDQPRRPLSHPLRQLGNVRRDTVSLLDCGEGGEFVRCAP